MNKDHFDLLKSEVIVDDSFIEKSFFFLTNHNIDIADRRLGLFSVDDI